MEDNKYLGNFTNGYKMYNVWRQSVEGESRKVLIKNTDVVWNDYEDG